MEGEAPAEPSSIKGVGSPLTPPLSLPGRGSRLYRWSLSSF